MPNALYTVIVEGGRPFSLHVTGNPPLDHGGGTSVFPMVLNLQEITEIKGAATAMGCRVEIRSRAGQTPEQGKLRARRLEPVVDVHCEMCPTCPWYDPFQDPDEHCGFLALPRESVAVLQKTSTPHADAVKVCPYL